MLLLNAHSSTFAKLKTISDFHYYYRNRISEYSNSLCTIFNIPILHRNIQYLSTKIPFKRNRKRLLLKYNFEYLYGTVLVHKSRYKIVTESGLYDLKRVNRNIITGDVIRALKSTSDRFVPAFYDFIYWKSDLAVGSFVKDREFILSDTNLKIPINEEIDLKENYFDGKYLVRLSRNNQMCVTEIVSKINCQRNEKLSSSNKPCSTSNTNKMTIINEKDSLLFDFEESNGRTSFLDHVTFSIDDKNCQVIDDAISYKRIDVKTFLIGVHVADVTYYLDSLPDLLKKVAFQGLSNRHNNNYKPLFGDKSFTSKCSLVAGFVRPTLSVIFTVTKSKIIKTEIFKGIIRSLHNFDFDTMNNIIIAVENQTYNESFYRKFDSLHRIIEPLTQILSFTNKYPVNPNSLGIDSEDVPVSARQNFSYLFGNNQTSKSSNLIKILMMAANRSVGFFLSLYSSYSIKSFQHVYTITCKSPLQQSIIDRKLREELKFLPKVIHFDRCESNTRRNSLNIYSHFTSPLRRISDIICHYQIRKIIENNKIPDFIRNQSKILPSICNAQKIFPLIKELMQSLNQLDSKINIDIIPHSHSTTTPELPEEIFEDQSLNVLLETNEIFDKNESKTVLNSEILKSADESPLLDPLSMNLYKGIVVNDKIYIYKLKKFLNIHYENAQGVSCPPSGCIFMVSLVYLSNNGVSDVCAFPYKFLGHVKL